MRFLEMLSQTQALLPLSLAGKLLGESLAMILTWFLESTVTPRAVPFSSSGTLVSFFLPHFYSAMEHGGQSRRTSTFFLSFFFIFPDVKGRGSNNVSPY